MTRQRTDPSAFRIGSILLPDRLGSFELRGITANEPRHPGLGFTAAYASAEFGEASIFIYNLGQRDIADGATTDAVVRQFNQAGSDILSTQRARLSARSLVAVGTKKDAFLGAEFDLETSLGAQSTFLLVTAYGGSFLKVRITLNVGVNINDPVGDFVEELGHQLWA